MAVSEQMEYINPTLNKNARIKWKVKMGLQRIPLVQANSSVTFS